LPFAYAFDMALFGFDLAVQSQSNVSRLIPSGMERGGKQTMAPSILVVSRDVDGLADTLDVLTSAGYRACGVSTFEEAKPLLATMSPAMMITDELLGSFNGLHLILHGRAMNPDMGAIATTAHKDPAFEAEARCLNVQYLVKPANPSEFLLPIAQTLKECLRPSPSTAS
jgi:DNA-binding NtrC family response regulator